MAVVGLMTKSAKNRFFITFLEIYISLYPERPSSFSPIYLCLTFPWTPTAFLAGWPSVRLDGLVWPQIFPSVPQAIMASTVRRNTTSVSPPRAWMLPPAGTLSTATSACAWQSTKVSIAGWTCASVALCDVMDFSMHVCRPLTGVWNCLE